MALIDHKIIGKWLVASRSSVVAEYFYPIPAQAKERPDAWFATKPSTRAFEEMIATATREQVDEKIYGAPLGCIVLCFISKRNHDVDNFLKSLLDAMQSIAFDDDKHFDFVLCARELSPDVSISVEVIKL